MHRKFSWWEILGRLDSIFICNETELLVHWSVLTLVFFIFLFALHGGNKPHYSCETLRVDVVQPQCRGWTQNGATGFLSNEQKHESFCHELNTHSIVKQTKAQINIVTIYNSPPQISINTVFFVLYLCVWFLFFFYFCT